MALLSLLYLYSVWYPCCHTAGPGKMFTGWDTHRFICSKSLSEAAAKSACPLKGWDMWAYITEFTARFTHCPDSRGTGSQVSSWHRPGGGRPWRPSLSRYGFVCGWHFGTAAGKGLVSLRGNSCQGKCIHFTKRQNETLHTLTLQKEIKIQGVILLLLI